jgi:TIM-barrel protein
MDSLKILAENFKDKIIIGNNSVDSIDKAREMLKYSDFVSVARAVLKGDIEWIREFNRKF